MRNTLAFALAASCACCLTTADVVIHTRSSEFRSAHSYPFAHSPPDFSDFTSINQLSPTGAGVVDLATFHSEHFASTASTSIITATMQSSAGYGQFNNRERWASSTWFAVVFAISQNASPLTIQVNGSTSAISPGSVSGFTLTVQSLTTAQTLFDSRINTPPTQEPVSGQLNWTQSTWSGTLSTGVYLLIAEAYGGPSGNQNLIGGSSSSTSVTFSAVFGPQPVPALALVPSPAAATLLTLLPAAAIRRRTLR